MSGRRGAGERPWFVDAFDRHYPLLYRHRDAAEARRAVAILPRLAPLGSGPVLDLGCGGGRHLVELSRQGVPVVGLDLSPALLGEAARLREAAGARYALVRADMRRLPLRPRAVTAVLSLFTAFGYFGGLAAHAPVLAEVARVLAPGGHWFLDYLDADRVRDELVAGPVRPHERCVGPLLVREQRRLEADPPVVAKDVLLMPREGNAEEAAALGVPREGRRYTERVALFSLAEIDAAAAAAGLARVAAAGNYDGGPLGAREADRWILVFRRANEPGASPSRTGRSGLAGE
ncbi:MAG: methyltransferase domain-containing protein [Candidatus Krumholzibacteriia bacterium]